MNQQFDDDEREGNRERPRLRAHECCNTERDRAEDQQVREIDGDEAGGIRHGIEGTEPVLFEPRHEAARHGTEQASHAGEEGTERAPAEASKQPRQLADRCREEQLNRPPVVVAHDRVHHEDDRRQHPEDAEHQLRLEDLIGAVDVDQLVVAQMDASLRDGQQMNDEEQEQRSCEQRRAALQPQFEGENARRNPRMAQSRCAVMPCRSSVEK